ncbi:MAG: flagellin [Alphaproteobacteria bacterium]|nr:flagellin [Alphaproteobacteria bacterium]
MSNVTLTSSMRSNLLSLQNTQKLMDTTQTRLSTGLKVNSAVDNPNAYFTASNLNNRASDLDALLDSMGQAVQTIKAADEGISSITTLVQQAKSLANTALADKTKGAETAAAVDNYTTSGTFAAAVSTSTITVNGGTTTGTVSTTVADTINTLATKYQDALNTAAGSNIFTVEVDSGALKVTVSDTSKDYTIESSSDVSGVDLEGATTAAVYDPSETKVSAQKSYNDLLTQIDQLANDANYKGVNLLTGDSLEVIFNEDRSSSINIKGVEANSAGLDLETVDFSTEAGIKSAISATEDAINKLRTYSSDFSNAYSVVQNREEFTENLINVLTEGADKLTLADMNEESANMLALQTRQQLGVNALSLASQAAQSVLNLF